MTHRYDPHISGWELWSRSRPKKMDRFFATPSQPPRVRPWDGICPRTPWPSAIFSFQGQSRVLPSTPGKQEDGTEQQRQHRQGAHRLVSLTSLAPSHLGRRAVGCSRTPPAISACSRRGSNHMLPSERNFATSHSKSVHNSPSGCHPEP